MRQTDNHAPFSCRQQIKVDPTNDVAATLQQEFVRLRPQKEHEREALLLSLCTRTYTQRVIVFLSSKVHAHRMKVLSSPPLDVEGSCPAVALWCADHLWTVRAACGRAARQSDTAAAAGGS